MRNKELHFDKCRQNPNWVNESGKKWSKEKRAAHSIAMAKAVRENPDSYSKNNVSGRVKIVEYRPGVKLKGSWEVKVASWLDMQGIIWESEVNPQAYYYIDKWRLYFPDFYLPELGIYIEVKGYKTDRDEAKWFYFSGDLYIIDSSLIYKLDEIDINDLMYNGPLV